MKYILLLLAVFIIVTGQILLKKGASMLPPAGNITALIPALITNPYIMGGLLFYGVSTVIWIITLKQVPLSVASPFMSLSYVFIFLYAFFVLKEKMLAQNIAGLFLIIIGVILVSSK